MIQLTLEQAIHLDIQAPSHQATARASADGAERADCMATALGERCIPD